LQWWYAVGAVEVEKLRPAAVGELEQVIHAMACGGKLLVYSKRS
jgi:hypothetical protein